MACADCPDPRACQPQGCRVRLAEKRVATVVGSMRAEMLDAAREALGLGRLVPAEDDFAPQLSRLNVEDGDILVVRTRRKVSQATAAKWQDGLERLVRAAGVKDVSILVLDDCTDITVERLDTRMQYQPPRPTPIVS